ncbi:MAG: glycoside hydrolase family 15 [Candidatus Brocadia sp. WS118]|nr:MAG: glycoside hydrolase family 15 [Candidatus Brocadia sp. WS118]
MPRDIPIGNGSLLITFDKDYRIRDIYFPNIGMENHTEGHPFRFGVWVDGYFSWMGNEWEKKLQYQEDALVTDVRAENASMGISLQMHDAVDFYLNVYIRQITVKNLLDKEREVRLFLNHDFHISESVVGDTAYYDPTTKSVIHYKGKRYFLINHSDAIKNGVDYFATGIKELHGAEGTWRDAEDGVLSRHPISQGSVDSTIGIHIPLKAHSEYTVYYWIAAGTTYEEVAKLNTTVWWKTPEELMKRTANYWRLWVNKEDISFDGLPTKIVKLFKRSLLILRTQIDNAGAVIAANDSDIIQFGKDTYSYMWPRDGALVVYALNKVGYSDITRRFFKFCADILSEDGYLLHKYNPDQSVASSWHPWLKEDKVELPIQEDETALVIWALWKYFDKYRDVEFIQPLYRDLIVKAAEFMIKFVDKETKLPLPSYDLWEERHGVHTFTVAAVVAGIKAGGYFANAFGECDRAIKYFRVAGEMKNAMVKYLYNREENRFARMGRKKGAVYELDMNVDASLYGLFSFEVFSSCDPMVQSTMQAVKDVLWVKTHVGGIARYAGDYYHRVHGDVNSVPGNPWFICTMWLAEYEIARAQNEDDLKKALSILEWVADHSLPSGVLAEQINPYTNEPVSVSPLTWSHATVVTTVIKYLEKMSLLITGNAYAYSRYNSKRYALPTGSGDIPCVGEISNFDRTL